MDEILKLLIDDEKLNTVNSIVKVYIDKYKPVVYELLHQVIDICDDYVNNKEFPMIIAKSKKNIYDAYINVGFTEEQALALMINDNIQLIKNMKTISSPSQNTKN